jgi:hypothetical protein
MASVLTLTLVSLWAGIVVLQVSYDGEFGDALEGAAAKAIRAISAKNRSSMLSQEAEVGVKCKWKRGCALIQRFAAGVLWVA